MALNMHVILWSPCLRSVVVLRQSTDKMRDHHSALHAQISVIPCEKKTTGIEHPGTWLIGGSLKNMEIDSFFTSCPEVKKGRKKYISKRQQRYYQPMISVQIGALCLLGVVQNKI